MLGSLPPTLDQTYERMLLNINEESVEDAKRLLALLCCAKRPLPVAEVIEGIAVELGDKPRLNSDARLFDQDEVRRLSPGLLELDEDLGGTIQMTAWAVIARPGYDSHTFQSKSI